MPPNVELYQQLGCLFYAIACESADGSLLVSDKERVEEIVLFNWVTLESDDRFNTDNAYRILTQFSSLDEIFAAADDAYGSFENYYHAHKDEFDSPLSDQIFASAWRIANKIGEVHHHSSTQIGRLRTLLNVEME